MNEEVQFCSTQADTIVDTVFTTKYLIETNKMKLSTKNKQKIHKSNKIQTQTDDKRIMTQKYAGTAALAYL